MTHTPAHESWRLAAELAEVARSDTAYADLFLRRARELLSPVLSEAQYAAHPDLEVEADNLTSRIANAMDVGDWATVRQLTAEVARVKRAASESKPVLEVAARVYDFDAILVDPFSPGIAGLAGLPERELGALRDRAVARLARLESADPPWAELYRSRRAALAALRLEALDSGPADAKPTAAGLGARARKALENGDLAQLEQLSAQLLESASTSQGTARGDTFETGPTSDFAQPFERDVCDRAAKLGLAAVRVESTAEQVRARFRPQWRPVFGADRGEATVRLSVVVPGDAPEALRDTLRLLQERAFVTSAGTRYMPWFLDEDLLLEDFDEPEPGASAASPLLDALQLPGRWGLARRTLEKALRVHGPAVVEQLGLDPRTHRVACLPVDVYTRLGAKRGWGNQQIWTHFDGYMASGQRKLMALVGGDARFGGLHDLVAVGADYDSDRLLARLAVVQRKRFAAW
jgi:hypothetical protein